MRTGTRVLARTVLTVVLAVPGWAGGSATVAQPVLRAQEVPLEEGVLSAHQEEDLYARATEALDAGRYPEAIRLFREVLEDGEARRDAAMYWIAYAQNRSGNPGQALRTIARLRTAYSDSPWLDDARYLEAEIRGASGQAPEPEETEDEELRMYALNSLMHVDAERAVPLLERILRGDESAEMKERALFILVQSGSERALNIVTDVARSAEDDELREQALMFIGMHGGEGSLGLLEELYAEIEEPDAKEAILLGFMRAGATDRLLRVAREESNEDLREAAIQQLAMIGGSDALWTLYDEEASVQAREAILHAMFRTGETERLMQVLRTEEELRLRQAALHALSMMAGPDEEGGQELREVLLQVYREDPNPDLREAVIHALWMRRDATTLIQLFEETDDPESRRRIVESLSMMDSEEAVEFLIQLIER